MIISGKDLLKPFFDNQKMPKNFIISDRTYYCPTEEIIKNDIYPKYKNWLISLKLFKWSHRWDCDNFADAFKVFAAGYYQQNIDSEAESIAIGTAQYIDDGNGHALNIIFLDNNNQVGIAFLEPQTGRITKFNLDRGSEINIFTIYI